MTHLPFADASIDVVLSFDVLYCLQAPAEQRRHRRDVQSAQARRCAVINVAALEILKGDHSSLGGEIRRYTRRQLQ